MSDYYDCSYNHSHDQGSFYQTLFDSVDFFCRFQSLLNDLIHTVPCFTPTHAKQSRRTLDTTGLQHFRLGRTIKRAFGSAQLR
jgi:hypothetical protein